MQDVEPGHRAGECDVQPVQAARLGSDDLGRLDHDDVVVPDDDAGSWFAMPCIRVLA
ncbi:hypothetical protein [Kribbella steppae]|uniref:hypothetical protein n=1 Tax=Kribbella steppae TaxID=2512223 RepID=UPI0018EEA1E0|nr:hypothetical protein [Kribbella steppae]